MTALATLTDKFTSTAEIVRNDDAVTIRVTDPEGDTLTVTLDRDEVHRILIDAAEQGATATTYEESMEGEMRGGAQAAPFDDGLVLIFWLEEDDRQINLYPSKEDAMRFGYSILADAPVVAIDREDPLIATSVEKFPHGNTRVTVLNEYGVTHNALDLDGDQVRALIAALQATLD